MYVCMYVCMYEAKFWSRMDNFEVLFKKKNNFGKNFF